MAVGDLTTTAAVKAYMAMAVATDDAVIGGLIAAASTIFAGYCDRTFQSTAQTYTRNGTGGTQLPLPDFPVTAVSSLQVDGQTIVSRPSVGAAGYVLVDDVLYLDGGYRFRKGIANVTVAYTAGYSTIPGDLAQACNETVASWYKRKARIDEQSKTVMGETVSFSMAEVPKTARWIVDLYQRPWPR